MNYLDPYTFYFELPLYSSIQITEENKADLWVFLNFSGKLDGYSPSLKENTTYTVKYGLIFNNVESFYEHGGVTSSKLTCSRNGEIFHFFFQYDIKKMTLQKIGQYPSIATLHISQIKQYNNVLNKEKIKEFTRAIGLAANGVGIGSFVYLRRIFEDLIEEAHTQAKTDKNWNEEEYRKQRMAEKIELLKHYLPTFLVENKSLYSILSLGLHELTEEDCLAFFTPVRIGIELILDEKVEQFEKIKKTEEARQKIAAITKKLQNKS